MINYPGISYLQGYASNPDIVGRFGQGFDLGRGIRAEQEAPDVFAQYLDSLMGGQGVSSAVSTSPTDGLIEGSHAAAQGATDPMLEAFFNATRQSESGGNDAARNPNSTATGRYQFLESTWNDLAQKNPGLGLTPDGRTDPAQQERAMRAFTAQNAKSLSGAGVPVNPGSLYAAHFLGPQGASGVLGLSDNTPMAAAVSPEVIQANPQLADMTVGQFKQWAAQKGGGQSGGYQPPMAQTPAGGAPMPAGGQGMPDRETMLALFRNPVTRPLAIDAIKTAQATTKPTDDIAEYMFALGQGYQGPLAQWLKDNKAGTTVNVGAGEKAWDTESAKLFAKKYDDLSTQAQTAQEMIGLFDIAQQAMDTGLRTGAFGENELDLRRFAQAIGVQDADNAEKVAGGELIRSVQNRMALIMRSPESGMGMPGAVSDRDLTFLKDAQIGLDRTPEGNRKMLLAYSALERRKIEVAQLADQYVEQNGRLDAGFNRVVREYAAANPLFEGLFGSAGGAGGAPEGVDQSLWEVMTPEERALWQN